MNQKYYNYSSELYSSGDQKGPMIEMAEKFLQIVEKANKPSNKDAPRSIFSLDGYLQLVSMQVTANCAQEEIDSNIQIMEDICAENGIIDGCQLVHSAKTIKIMMLMKPDTV